MSDPDDARAYVDALNAIGQAGREEVAHQSQLVQQRSRRFEAGKVEIAEVRAKRHRIQKQVAELRQRLDEVPPEDQAADAYAGSTEITSLDELIETLDQCVDELDRTEKDLHAARGVRATRRRLLIAALVVVLGPIAVTIAGGGALLAAGCVVLVVVALARFRADANPWAVVPAAIVAVALTFVAGAGWTWWHALIAIGVLFIAARIVRRPVAKVRSAVRDR